MADSFFRWPVAIEQSRKSTFQRLRQVLLFLLPVLFFLTAVYLIFQKLQKPPLAQIEEHLARQEFSEALELCKQELERGTTNYLRYLMLATVAAEGLLSADTSDYEAQLRRADQSGIYLKESYFKRFELISDLPDFPALLVSYAATFSLEKAGTDFFSLLEKHLDSERTWLPMGEQEAHRFFELVSTLFPQRVMTVTGNNLQLRQQPSLESKTLARLPADLKVLRRLRGPEIVAGGRRANWLYIFTPEQLSGWAFGGYLK